MEISEVRIKLISNPSDRLKAFASVTLDSDFVVRDIKVIDGTTGVFVAMPSRKLADRCENCGCKNHVRAKFCNECGKTLPRDRAPRDTRGRSKLHADIAHPINSECRQMLQERIVEAFHAETENASQPGYRPLSDDEFDGEMDGPKQAVGETREESNDGVGNRQTPPIEAPTGFDNDEDHVDRDQEVVAATEPQSDPSEGEDVSDYQSLIADLKRDGAKSRQARATRARHQDQRKSNQEPGRERSVPTEQNRRESRPSREPAESDRGRDSSRGRPRPAPRTQPVTAQQPKAASPRPTTPPAPRRPASPPKPQPLPVPVREEVEDEFGSGII